MGCVIFLDWRELCQPQVHFNTTANSCRGCACSQSHHVTDRKYKGEIKEKIEGKKKQKGGEKSVLLTITLSTRESATACCWRQDVGTDPVWLCV